MVKKILFALIFIQSLIIIYLVLLEDKEVIVVKTKYQKIIEKEYLEKEFFYEVFEVTAYTPGIESTGKDKNHPEYKITASGKIAIDGWTIACPKEMEFGTKLYFPKYDRIYICEDRGSAITKGKLDIYMEDLNNALEYGRRFEDVLILPSYP